MQSVTWIKKLDHIIYGLLILLAASSCISDAFCRNLVRVLIPLSIVRIALQPQLLMRLQPYGTMLKAFICFFAMLLVEALYGGHFFSVLQEGRIVYMYNILLLFLMPILIKNELQIRNLFYLLLVSLACMDLHIFWQAYHGVPRPVSSAWSVPATTAMFYMVLTPFLGVMLIYKKKISYVILLIATITALLLTQTRGAWLAILPVGLYLLVYYMRNIKKILLAVVLGASFIAIFMSFSHGLQEHVRSIGNPQTFSVAERFKMWRSAEQMFADHPLMGVGLGNYAEAYQKVYILPEAREPWIFHAHNNFIHFFAEDGLFGGVIFLGLNLYLLYWGWKRRSNFYGMIFFSSTLALALFSFTDYAFAQFVGMRLYYFCGGLCLAGAEQQSVRENIFLD